MTTSHNVEAEAALIGCMLMNNQVIEQVLEVVNVEDFWEPVHQRIMYAITKQADQGRAVTPVTLKPIFDRDPGLKELGGIGYLAKLTSDPMSLLDPMGMAGQIAELSRIREMQEAMAMFTGSYMAGEATFAEALGYVEDAMTAASGRTTTAPVHTASGMVGLVKERAEKLTLHALDDGIGVRTSTVSDLNTLLGPIEDGTYIVIGGRPGMGKTTLASSAAWGFAAKGYAVSYLAAEGTENALAMRFTADLSLESEMPITHDQIRRDNLNHAERAHVDRLQETAESLPIEYQAVGRCDIRRLRSYVARSKARFAERGHRLRVVVVDYMQLLTASQNGREIFDDRVRINTISAGLLAIAKDFEVTVIALSQLTRALEQRDDKRPRLSDLRESGRIEEDADAVLFAYREEYYLERAKPEPGSKDYQDALNEWEVARSRCRDRVDLILAKNRHGEVRTRTAKFFGKFSAIRGGDFDLPVPGEFDFDEGRAM